MLKQNEVCSVLVHQAVYLKYKNVKKAMKAIKRADLTYFTLSLLYESPRIGVVEMVKILMAMGLPEDGFN